MPAINFFEFYATRVKTRDGHELFSFPMDGKKILHIATVSRIKREGTEIDGFQRPEVKSHIKTIAEYIESEGAMIPNAIVLAFSDPEVSFKKIKSGEGRLGDIGVLKVPDHMDSDTRPAFIVDGQQRTRAIQNASVASFPIVVCAFKEQDPDEMAQQFYNVNATKPLPRELIVELLPHLSAVPGKMRPKQVAAELGNELAFDSRSPFCGIVKSTSSSVGVMRLNSIINPLEVLLADPGSYLGMQFSHTGGIVNKDEILNTLFNYWTAVSQVFSHAWGLSNAKKSRLMHGTGMYAMFQLTTKVLDKCNHNPDVDELVEHISLLVPHCHWTEADGDWINIDGFGLNIPWNGLENTARGKKTLTAYIIRKYVEALQDAR